MIVVVPVMTKIAIIGATGPTGIHLVAELCHTAAGRVIRGQLSNDRGNASEMNFVICNTSSLSFLYSPISR